MATARRTWTLIAVSLATFMTYLDNNIVNVAIPAIQRDLHLTTAGLEWVVSGYILVFASLLLAGGRLGDLFGRRRLFLLGLAATGEIFRRGGAQWGYVAEVSLVFAGILIIAVLLTSGSARSRIRAIVVDNFFSHRYDYRREWMRCIDTLTAPAAHTSLPMRAIRAVAEVVDSPAGVLFVRAPEEVAFQWAG